MYYKNNGFYRVTFEDFETERDSRYSSRRQNKISAIVYISRETQRSNQERVQFAGSTGTTLLDIPKNEQYNDVLRVSVPEFEE